MYNYRVAQSEIIEVAESVNFAGLRDGVPVTYSFAYGESLIGQINQNSIMLILK